ncbi:MAG: chemotaxis protein CheC [Proteobacteria bacterium]|nr:chemotaxis protein CheC [Pseudomonadota bacterium]
MNTSHENIFSEEEKDILQEIMNIAFGNATADLANIIDIYVVLNVPDIHVIGVGDLPKYLDETIKLKGESSIVEQKFWGDFNGSGLLVFPDRTGKDLISVLDHNEQETFERPLAILEQEMLVEIGNILIGACVGKVADLLDTFVTYSPPQAITQTGESKTTLIESFDLNQSAIIMKTVFEFEKKNINGFLLIITNSECIGWLRKALNAFMESYE